MSAGHPHPSRAGEPAQATARVRHRLSGREGRVCGEAASGADDVQVLFDGDTRASSVPRRNLDYCDGAGAPAARLRP